MLTDRELLTKLKSGNEEEKKVLEGILWERYEKLIQKNWGILRRQLNNSSLIWDLEDDFYSDCYLAMKRGIHAINLDKIKNDNWKFLGYYRLYLKNVRAKMIKDVCKLAEKEKSMIFKTSEEGEVSLADMSMAHSDSFVVNDNPADLLIEGEELDEVEKAVNSCMRKWDTTRQGIFKLKEKGLNVTQIASSYKVHPATISYYLRTMKKDFIEELKK